MLPICQAIPLTVNVCNFCLNELKCGDSVCNVSVLIIPIYLTCTSSCEGNLNESSLFSSLLCCIISGGWAVPGLAHSWKYVLQHPGACSSTINLLGEQYKMTVLSINPFKGTLFFVYSKKETRTMSIKNLSILHVLWTSVLLVVVIIDGQATLLVWPPTLPHSHIDTAVVTC